MMTTAMDKDTQFDEVRERAKNALDTLRGLCRDEDVQASKVLVEELRNAREYERMGQLAEAVSRPRSEGSQEPSSLRAIPDRHRQGDGGDRRPAAAGAAPAEGASRVRRGHRAARPRVQADLLRCRRQDQPGRARGAQAGDRRLPQALRGQTAANTWHGVNLVALLTRARRLGLRIGSRPPAQGGRAGGGRGTRGDAAGATRRMVPADPGRSVARSRDWDAVERNVKEYAADGRRARRSRSRARCASSRRSGTWKRRTSAGAGWSPSCARGCCSCRAAALRWRPETSQRLRDPAGAGSGPARSGARQRRGRRPTAGGRLGLDRALAVASIRQRLGEPRRHRLPRARRAILGSSRATSCSS